MNSTKLEYVTCNFCGSTESRELFPSTLPGEGKPSGKGAFRCTSSDYGFHARIVQCANCGLAYANPRHKGDEILGLYESVKDPLYLEEREGRELTFRKRLAAFERVSGPGAGRRLLDVGAYIGVFVEIAREAGWQAEGLEVSQWAVEQGKAVGLPMTAGTLDSAGYADESFDAVTLWDVIEHLLDPLHELTEARRVLRPGGHIVIHTMDRESLFAKVMGKRWPWLMEMHLYFFSPRTLKAMLEKAGFEVISIQPQGRYLRLGYLVTRVRPYSRVIVAILLRLVNLLGLRELAIPINFGDLVTAYARKRGECVAEP